MNRRLILIAGGMLAACPAMARSKRSRVLLVCQFGSVKSAIARELVIRRAAERGIQVSVASRGITPEAHIDRDLLARLRADSIDPEREPLTALAPADVARADYVVVFNNLPAGFRPRKLIDWRDTGSFNDSFAAEAPRLLKRIDALLDTLGAR